MAYCPVTTTVVDIELTYWCDEKYNVYLPFVDEKKQNVKKN